MSNPKFVVGDLVAVCTADLVLVIPETCVVGREVDEAGVFECPVDGQLYMGNGGYSYLVAGSEFWIPEEFLRPILPGEYLESTRDQAIQSEVGA